MQASVDGKEQAPMRFTRIPVSEIAPAHFRWEHRERVATITLSRPVRKNPLTLDSYPELRDTFRKLQYVDEVRAVVLTGAEEHFCSGGDVRDIIGPPTAAQTAEIREIARMTRDLVKAMRDCPQPIVAAVDGVCVGAGAILAMASDLRYATARSKTAFLSVRVGLAGCDMGACAMLPRLIGQGRASELLYAGRAMSADEGLAWGFFNGVADACLDKAMATARELAAGPTAAHAMTKKMLHQEWNAGVDEAIEMEAQAQAILMQSRDFRRAYEAFAAKQKPAFEGN